MVCICSLSFWVSRTTYNCSLQLQVYVHLCTFCSFSSSLTLEGELVWFIYLFFFQVLTIHLGLIFDWASVTRGHVLIWSWAALRCRFSYFGSLTSWKVNLHLNIIFAWIVMYLALLIFPWPAQLHLSMMLPPCLTVGLLPSFCHPVTDVIFEECQIIVVMLTLTLAHLYDVVYLKH